MVVEVEATALVLAIILFLGLLAPEVFKKFKLTYVSSLIIIGAILGPNGIDYLQSNDVLEFFGFMGSAFLLLMAGLEVKIETLRGMTKNLIILSSINGLVPFTVGVTIIRLFGYPWITAFLVGIVFISSSVAIIISAVRHAKLDKKWVGKYIISAVVIQDLVSLFLLSFLLQTVAPVTRFPLIIYFGILIFSLVVLKMFLPEVSAYFLRKTSKKGDEYETEIRYVLLVLLLVLTYFSGLGVHPIVAAFLVGMLLSDVIKSEEMFKKIHTLGYALFVPVFLFIVGMKMDLKILGAFDYKNALLISVVLGSILSKFCSGYVAARIAKFTHHNAKLFGIITTPQLTTTLAVAYAATQLEIISTPLLTSVVFLSVVTTIIAPIGFDYIAKTKRRKSRA